MILGFGGKKTWLWGGGGGVLCQSLWHKVLRYKWIQRGGGFENANSTFEIYGKFRVRPTQVFDTKVLYTQVEIGLR